MARRKLKDKNIRKLSRIGNSSLGLTIPIEIVRKLKWRQKQKVTVHLEGRKLVVKDWER